MGRILDMAIADARRFTNSGGFETELTITPTGGTAVVVNGIASRHSQGFDEQGLPIISNNVHCSFSEKDLNDLSVVTRNASGKLAIKGWLVSWTDAIGSANYKFAEPQPDNTLGLIKVTLSQYE